MEEQSAEHRVGQCVLLIQQQVQERAVGTAAFHLSRLQHGRPGVRHTDGALGGDDDAHDDDDGFSEGTGARLTAGSGSGLEQGLPECHIEVKAELFVFGTVVSHPGKQDKL